MAQNIHKTKYPPKVKKLTKNKKFPHFKKGVNYKVYQLTPTRFVNGAVDATVGNQAKGLDVIYSLD